MVTIRHQSFTINRRLKIIANGDRKFRFRLGSGERKYIANDVSIPFEFLSILILNGPTSTQEMFERIYGNDPAGGPNAGRQFFHERIHRWDYIFKNLDLKLCRDRRAGVNHFYLEGGYVSYNGQRKRKKRGS